MECDAYGIELPPLKERFDRFDEGVEVMLALLTEPVANFSGTYFKLTEARCEPKPAQRPHPPVTIGGSGPKRTLRAAARWAQQWNMLVRGDISEWVRAKEILAGHCAAIGRDVNEITCSVNVRLDDGVDAAVEQATVFRDAGVDLAILNLPHHAKPESLAPLAEALAHLA
jgi:alkanesulfonate monooxygenase SsuD/methylene tetrahydromethanopterin reductase-like flavin-dependent oxidoreductase (luciferase family)